MLLNTVTIFSTLELAAEFIARPQNQEVVEGENAQFMCSVSKDTYEVKWLKGDKELQSDDKYDIISEGKKRVLVVKNCELKDEGGFVVLIGTTRAVADLTVLGMYSMFLCISLRNYYRNMKMSIFFF